MIRFQVRSSKKFVFSTVPRAHAFRNHDMRSAAIFAVYGKALQGIRDKVYLQIHFGADYTSGEYGWTTDLALQGDALAREHYLTLEKRAGDCIGCGHCNGRCPFHVAQSRRMQEMLAYFGA